MEIPLTPTGVEHFPMWECSPESVTVEIPLTPTGVEHDATDGVCDDGYVVEIPLTPTGVEHNTGSTGFNQLVERGDSFDADRR